MVTEMNSVTVDKKEKRRTWRVERRPEPARIFPEALYINPEIVTDATDARA